MRPEHITGYLNEPTAKEQMRHAFEAGALEFCEHATIPKETLYEAFESWWISKQLAHDSNGRNL